MTLHYLKMAVWISTCIGNPTAKYCIEQDESHWNRLQDCVCIGRLSTSFVCVLQSCDKSLNNY